MVNRAWIDFRRQRRSAAGCSGTGGRGAGPDRPRRRAWSASGNRQDRAGRRVCPEPGNGAQRAGNRLSGPESARSGGRGGAKDPDSGLRSAVQARQGVSGGPAPGEAVSGSERRSRASGRPAGGVRPVAGRRVPRPTFAGPGVQSRPNWTNRRATRPRFRPSSFQELPSTSRPVPVRVCFRRSKHPPGRSAAASMPAALGRNIRPPIVAVAANRSRHDYPLSTCAPSGFLSADSKAPCQIGVFGTWGVSQASLAGDCPGERPSARRERQFRGAIGAESGRNRGSERRTANNGRPARRSIRAETGGRTGA